MVKILFDTSVLVASILVKHPQHFSGWSWLEQVKTAKIEGFIVTHTLMEINKILTLNPKHFIRLGDRIAELVEVPL